MVRAKGVSEVAEAVLPGVGSAVVYVGRTGLPALAEVTAVGEDGALTVRVLWGRAGWEDHRLVGRYEAGVRERDCWAPTAEWGVVG